MLLPYSTAGSPTPGLLPTTGPWNWAEWVAGQSAYRHMQLNLCEQRASEHLCTCAPASTHTNWAPCLHAGPLLAQGLCARAWASVPASYSYGSVFFSSLGHQVSKVGDRYSTTLKRVRSQRFSLFFLVSYIFSSFPSPLHFSYYSHFNLYFYIFWWTNKKIVTRTLICSLWRHDHLSMFI